MYDTVNKLVCVFVNAQLFVCCFWREDLWLSPESQKRVLDPCTSGKPPFQKEGVSG